MFQIKRDDHKNKKMSRKQSKEFFDKNMKWKQDRDTRVLNMRKKMVNPIQHEQMDRIRQKAKRLISPNFDQPNQRIAHNHMT